MPAGREMDALVAERVMGLSVPPRATTERTIRRVCDDLGGRGTEWVIEYPPYYSTSIAAAWGVVEHLDADSWEIRTMLYGERGWFVRCHHLAALHLSALTPMEEWVRAAAAPLAICRSALLAVMSE